MIFVWSFAAENDLLSSLCWIWIKSHFLLQSPFVYLRKITIQQTGWVSITITENSDVSSANSFAFEFKQLTLGERPLWYLPMTNADRLTQLCFPQFKTIFNEVISFPDVLFCCNLKSKHLCKTLSNALDMSRETPLTSWPSSNAERISSAIDSN